MKYISLLFVCCAVTTSIQSFVRLSGMWSMSPKKDTTKKTNKKFKNIGNKMSMRNIKLKMKYGIKLTPREAEKYISRPYKFCEIKAREAYLNVKKYDLWPTHPHKPHRPRLGDEHRCSNCM